MDRYIPVEVREFFGLNSKTARSKLALGFSPDVETFHDIDLSTPGKAKTRGGRRAINETPLSYTPNRLLDAFNPTTNVHRIFISGGQNVDLMRLDTGAVTNLATGLTAGLTQDMLNFGAQLFFANGTDDGKIYDWSTTRKWGIDGPTDTPTYAADSGTGITGTYSYRYTFVNSTSGHESSASPASAAHSVTNKTINLQGLVASADPQVDKINIYRTTNGGAIYFYLTQINNGTTTYADSTADASLGSTEAPYYNDPPPSFIGIEEWDGRIFGFQPNDTKVYFLNDEFWSVVGRPEESMHPNNYIDFFAKVYGIKKSPNFNELWVHTSNGIYAIIRTEFPEDPYTAVVRLAGWYTISHYSIVNIYNEQWFLAEGGKQVSIDSAGNINYVSYLWEPDLTAGNQVRFPYCQGVQYRSGSKNQYRLIYPGAGNTNFSVMAAANYLQRTPPDENGRTYPVWEYHKRNSTCIGVVKDSTETGVLLTGWTDGVIYQEDYGTNDNGDAIDWSFSLGWVRCNPTIEKSFLIRRILQYFNPIDNYSFSLRLDFEFGASGGQVYTITLVKVGDRLDIDFVFDTSVFGPDSPLQRIPTDVRGDYTYLRATWFGNALDQIMELNTLAFIAVPIEGLRDINA